MGTKNALSYKKRAHKILMKLTPVVNFTNVLRTAFTLVDLKSVKIPVSHWYLFTLSGSASVKAVHRSLMKLSPDCSKWRNKVKVILSYKILKLQDKQTTGMKIKYV